VLLAGEVRELELGRRTAGPRLEIRGRRGERSHGAQQRGERPEHHAVISREVIV